MNILEHYEVQETSDTIEDEQTSMKSQGELVLFEVKNFDYACKVVLFKKRAETQN
jgi:hypothetical protein